MNRKNRYAALSQTETEELTRMEGEFQTKFGTDVILVAYEKQRN